MWYKHPLICICPSCFSAGNFPIVLNSSDFVVEQWTEEETKRTMVDTLKLLNAVEAYKDDWETIGRELG